MYIYACIYLHHKNTQYKSLNINITLEYSIIIPY